MTDPVPRPTWRRRLLSPLRPLAQRVRSYLAGPLHAELAGLRAEVAALRIELRERDLREAASVDQRIEATLEQALLTLALDREERRGPRN